MDSNESYAEGTSAYDSLDPADAACGGCIGVHNCNADEDSSVMEEQEKYEKMWDIPEYRKNSPGEFLLGRWLAEVEPEVGMSINDYGCGPGRAAFKLFGMGYDVKMFDIAKNSLDPIVEKQIGEKFTAVDLSDPEADLPEERADYGYCTDVMEHLPEENVEGFIKNVAKTCNECFFAICLRDDHFGDAIGEDLHLTVKPFMWWRNVLRKYGKIVDARHLIENGWFRVRFINKGDGPSQIFDPRTIQNAH